MVLVSHDRKFLDSVTNRTVEISFRKLNDYKAAYSKYTTLREDRILKQIQAKKNQDKYIEETKVLINKFRAKKNKAAFAQTLIRKLEKLERIEVEQEDVAKMNFKFHGNNVIFDASGILENINGVKLLDLVDLMSCLPILPIHPVIAKLIFFI